MAGLVPGVVTGRLDVGGTEGAQQYNIEAFGSANSQKSFSIDGLKVNWAGGDGGATMMYYGFEMYEEYNMRSGSGARVERRPAKWPGCIACSQRR